MCVAHLAGVRRLHDKIIETIFFGSLTERAKMVQHAQGCPACWRELGAAIDDFLNELGEPELRTVVSELIKVRLEVAVDTERRWRRLNQKFHLKWNRTPDNLPN